MSKLTMLQRRAKQCAKRGEVICPSADNISDSGMFAGTAGIEALQRIARAHSEGRVHGKYKGTQGVSARYKPVAPVSHYYAKPGVTALRDTLRD